MRRPSRAAAPLFAVLSLVASVAPVAVVAPVAASHTPTPTSVTIAGSLQSELGCPDDWQADCAATHLTYDATDDAWQQTFAVPGGNWDYKAPLNDSWTENYGLHAVRDGANIPLPLATGANVKFYYDHKTHWVTDGATSTIIVAAGSFQSEIGCPGDWDPGCLRSWLEDPDGDGTYTFVTTAIPTGNYEAKAAIGESWAENYGQGGVRDGANIAFSVPANATTTFGYNGTTHVLTISSVSGGPGHDNNVEWDGLRHDSRDVLYRTPGGAVAAGTRVTLRFRTFHDDVTSVKVRFYSLRLGGQQVVPMQIAAAGIGCYEAALTDHTCDFWQVTTPASIADEQDNLWYRFIVSDGSDTDYYADNTAALDGGLGSPSDEPVDFSWALMQFVPGFTSPTWARDAVVYQIFPDRFRSGRSDNDAQDGDTRYDDPVIKLGWGVKPEGFCRNYEDGDVNCPWRFDDTPPDYSPTKESPRGRDYYGGDLRGVDQKLDYLAALGVNTIYLNPIFDAGSNHSYDTQDYTKVDPYFGTQKDFDNLVKHARALGIRIILDGVFNHMSSDSPLFDRYHHYSTVGACESLSSPYRSWFVFRNDHVPCDASDYEGWFGFDSIPVLRKTEAQVRDYFLTAPDSIAKRWLRAGAAGWRLDVSGDPSFPDGYWESFRTVVKATSPSALTISETWQKDSTLLRMLRGDRLDTTMNYRLRDAVIGLLAPGTFDSKGFPDSGRIISPSEFAARLLSQREDYPDAAYYALMNVLDSHDTERLLWTLTPGPETTAGREGTAANVAAGKLRLRLASLIQFTVPGAPTVYYGDEVGLTGDDDPDDRRTYPWADRGGSPDADLLAHYTSLASLRHELTALTDGDLRMLLADDDHGTLAYGRRTGSRAAVIAVNRFTASQTLEIPVASYLPDGTSLARRLGIGTASTGALTVAGGMIQVTLPAMSGLLLATGPVDLTPPPAPTGLHVTAEASHSLSVAWSPAVGAASYDVWFSPLSGGGYVKANSAPITGTSFTIDGLENARTWYVIVRAVDGAGNASSDSGETSGIPHLVIGWANLQWPPTMTHTISATDRTDDAYGQVWIDGETNQSGATQSLRAQLGYGPDGSNPDGNAAWHWSEATFNTDVGNNDEFVASLLPEMTGTFDYAYRYTTTGGRDWIYADLDGINNGYSPAQAGSLIVDSSADTTAPATPGGLHVVSASPAGIALAWDAVPGDPTLYGYEVLRRGSSGSLAVIASTTSPSFSDQDVVEGATYHYAVRSVDTSFNRSATSAEVAATAVLRTVSLQFQVSVPATTDATGRSVYIAGFLDRLDGNLPQWDPGGVVLTRTDATHWAITLSGQEGTQLEYKYTLGDWDHVEKDAGCGEIANRQLTLSYGVNGTQVVSDTVANWRNVAPCGN